MSTPETVCVHQYQQHPKCSCPSEGFGQCLFQYASAHCAPWGGGARDPQKCDGVSNRMTPDSSCHAVCSSKRVNKIVNVSICSLSWTLSDHAQGTVIELPARQATTP